MANKDHMYLPKSVLGDLLTCLEVGVLDLELGLRNSREDHMICISNSLWTFISLFVGESRLGLLQK